MICLAVADLNLCKYAVVLIHGEVHDCLVEVLTHGNACNILHCAVVGVVVPKVHAHLIVAFYALVVVYMSVSAGFEHRKIFIHLLDAVGHDDLYSVDLSLFFLLLVYYFDCIAFNNNIDLDILVAVFHDCLGDFGTLFVCPFCCICVFVNRHCVGIGYLITLCINIVYCDILFLYDDLIVENELILGGILGDLDCLHIVFVVGVKLICSAAVGVVGVYLGSDALALFAVVCAVVGLCSDKALDAVSDLIVMGCYGVSHLLGLGIYFAVSLGDQLAVEEHCVILFADMSGICGIICLAVADLYLCKYAVVLIHGEVHDCLVEVLTHGNACNILHCAVVGVVVPKVHAHLIVAFYALVVVYMSVSAGFEHRKIFIHLLDAVGHYNLNSIDIYLLFLLLIYYCDCIAVNSNIGLDIFAAVFHDCTGNFGALFVCPFCCICIFVNSYCVGIGYHTALCVNIVHCDILFLGLRLFCILLCKCYPIVVCAVFVVIVVAVAALLEEAFKYISAFFGHNNGLSNETFKVARHSVYRDVLAVRFACLNDCIACIADSNLNGSFGSVAVNVYLNP